MATFTSLVRMLLALSLHLFFLSTSATVFQHVDELKAFSYDFIVVGGEI